MAFKRSRVRSSPSPPMRSLKAYVKGFEAFFLYMITFLKGAYMPKASPPTTPQETVPNCRRYGFIFALLAMALLSAIFFYLDCVAIGVTLVILGVMQLVLFFLSPRCYIFSKDALRIKYYFSLEEIIPWENISSITKDMQKPFKYFYLESYELFYRSDKSLPFFMRGIVNKNKTSTALLKKYCKKNSNF